MPNAKIEIVKTFEFASRSSSKIYKVLLHLNSALTCNCPGWIFKKAERERNCRHIDAIRSGRFDDALVQ